MSFLLADGRDLLSTIFVFLMNSSGLKTLLLWQATDCHCRCHWRSTHGFFIWHLEGVLIPRFFTALTPPLMTHYTFLLLVLPHPAANTPCFRCWLNDSCPSNFHGVYWTQGTLTHPYSNKCGNSKQMRLHG